MATIRLEGTIVPKARPRVTRKGWAYMPKNYVEWKQKTSHTIQNLITPVISGSVSVRIELYGKHSRRGDLDNVAGSCLDALVQAGILIDDNMTRVVNLTTAIFHSNALPYFEITITPTK